MSLSDLLVQVVPMVLTAGAIYGSIRSDLRHIHEKIADLDNAINRRIDDLMRD